jgi:pimeloyl-ACP methyl ester carboxylesterase
MGVGINGEKERRGDLPMSLLVLNEHHHIFYDWYAGEDERPCLIFLHEGLGCAAQWKEFPQRLCQRTGCPGLVYDRIGHGKSSPLTHPRTIRYLHEAALDELPKVIEALIPGQRFILVGHSDGGSISLIFCAKQHPLLLGSITVAAHVFVEQVSLDGIARAKEAFAQGKLRKGLVRYHGDNTEPLFTAWAETWTSPWFASWHIEDLLPSIDVPLLVLQGRDDQYGTSAQVETIVKTAGGPATPLLLEDCGHAPHLEFPELSLDLMSCFVNRLAR